MVNYETPNTANFKYLKQLICILQVQRLNCAIKVNDMPMTLAELSDQTKRVLDTIKMDFQQLHLLPDGSCVTDLNAVRFELESIAHEPPTVHVTESIINDYPKKAELLLCYRDIFKTQNGFFHNQTALKQEVLHAADVLFNRIASWIADGDVHGENTIEHVIVFTNNLEATDFLFLLTNEHWVISQEDVPYEQSHLEEPPLHVMDIPLEVVEGLEHLLRTRFDPTQFVGSEQYVVDYLKYSDVQGLEAGFWDNFKDMITKLAKAIKEGAKDFYDFFMNDGQKQIDDTKVKVENALKAMKDVNGNIPIPDDSNLISPAKYFKKPSVEGLDEKTLSVVNAAITAIEASMNGLESVNNVATLIDKLSAISTASIEQAQKISDLIKGQSTAVTKSADDLTKITPPQEGDESQTKDSKKIETQEKMKKAKSDGNGLKKLAAYRNKILAPALVVANSLPGVVKLKETKSFKG